MVVQVLARNMRNAKTTTVETNPLRTMVILVRVPRVCQHADANTSLPLARCTLHEIIDAENHLGCL